MARRKPLHSGSGTYVPDGLGGYLDAGGVKVATRIQSDSHYDQSISNARRRVSILSASFLLAFVIVGIRLFDATLVPATKALSNPWSSIDDGRLRADITDRNGEVLATNLAALSLFADTREVWNPERAAYEIATVLPQLDEQVLLRQLSSGGHNVELARRITPREKQEIFALGLPGLHFPKRERRYYPRGRYASHLLGYVDADNAGISGIEAKLNAQITERAAQPLALSLDIRIQHILRDEIAKSVGVFQAKAGAGVIMDVRTGEVIAMTSLPDFDPNNPMASPESNRFNQVTKGVYELGSVFKMFTVAMALDDGSVRLTDGYDTSQPLRFGRFRIRDFHGKNKWQSIPEIFMHSSNIGTAKIARAVGIPGHQTFLRKIGMFDPIALEVPEIGAPKVPEKWRDVRAATISYGHGIAVTPLHVANAAAAMVNGGVLHQPTIVKSDRVKRAKPTRVISTSTSQAMRTLLRSVVTEGTGGNGDVAGYSVGGKTGTAEKSRGGSYARRSLISSFLATFPTYDPQYVVFVMLDEPRGTKETYGYATAGWTAAPMAARIIGRSGPLLGVAPKMNLDTDIQQAALKLP